MKPISTAIRALYYQTPNFVFVVNQFTEKVAKRLVEAVTVRILHGRRGLNIGNRTSVFTKFRKLTRRNIKIT